MAISGLFRDLFPAQIALIDAAVRAVRRRARKRQGKSARGRMRRVGDLQPSPVRAHFWFGSGAYGAGVEDFLGRDLDRAQSGALTSPP